MIDEKVLLKEIERGRKCGFCAITYDDLEERIKGMPKVGEWIPCSERLPESKREEVVRSWYIVTLATGAVVEKCFDFIKKEWVTDIEVIAWMPLPEPYKKGGV